MRGDGLEFAGKVTGDVQPPAEGRSGVDDMVRWQRPTPYRVGYVTNAQPYRHLSRDKRCGFVIAMWIKSPRRKDT